MGRRRESQGLTLKRHKDFLAFTAVFPMKISSHEAYDSRHKTKSGNAM